jgi:hypothetical protein
LGITDFFKGRIEFSGYYLPGGHPDLPPGHEDTKDYEVLHFVSPGVFVPWWQFHFKRLADCRPE